MQYPFDLQVLVKRGYIVFKAMFYLEMYNY